MKILIMGLSGAGKTTLATQLHKALPESLWLNADQIREMYDDWDFSAEGRMRQAHRMMQLSNWSDKRYIIADFIAPLQAQRELFNPHVLIWMNTIQSCKFTDTNEAFQAPACYTLRFDSFGEVNVERVLEIIKSEEANLKEASTSIESV